MILFTLHTSQSKKHKTNPHVCALNKRPGSGTPYSGQPTAASAHGIPQQGNSSKQKEKVGVAGHMARGKPQAWSWWVKVSNSWMWMSTLPNTYTHTHTSQTQPLPHTHTLTHSHRSLYIIFPTERSSTTRPDQMFICWAHAGLFRDDSLSILRTAAAPPLLSWQIVNHLLTTSQTQRDWETQTDRLRDTDR